MTDAPPTEKKSRSRRIYVYWSVALALLLALGLVSGVGWLVYQEFFVPKGRPPMKNIPDMTPETWEYTGDLHRAIKGATKLRIRTTLDVHRSGEYARLLYGTTDQEAMALVADRLAFKKENRKGYCSCEGDPVFEWYKGEELLVKVSVHHGKTLRWSGHWPGDAHLTPESSKWLCAWLRRIGLDPVFLPDEVRGQSEESK